MLGAPPPDSEAERLRHLSELVEAFRSLAAQPSSRSQVVRTSGAAEADSQLRRPCFRAARRDDSSLRYRSRGHTPARGSLQGSAPPAWSDALARRSRAGPTVDLDRQEVWHQLHADRAAPDESYSIVGS